MLRVPTAASLWAVPAEAIEMCAWIHLLQGKVFAPLLQEEHRKVLAAVCSSMGHLQIPVSIEQWTWRMSGKRDGDESLVGQDSYHGAFGWLGCFGLGPHPAQCVGWHVSTENPDADWAHRAR